MPVLNKDRVQLTLPKGVVGTNLLEDLYDKPFGIYYDNNFKIFKTKSSNPGQIVISRLDTVNRIVSGRFTFDAEFVVSRETVKITEGRFDVKYDWVFQINSPVLPHSPPNSVSLRSFLFQVSLITCLLYD